MSVRSESQGTRQADFAIRRLLARDILMHGERRIFEYSDSGTRFYFEIDGASERVQSNLAGPPTRRFRVTSLFAAGKDCRAFGTYDWPTTMTFIERIYDCVKAEGLCRVASGERAILRFYLQPFQNPARAAEVRSGNLRGTGRGWVIERELTDQ